MKNTIILSLIFLSVMLSMPLLIMDKSPRIVSKVNSTESNDNRYIDVILNNSQSQQIERREFIIGTLAAEMDINYSDEALKAQAVACSAYAEYLAVHSENSVEHQNYADINERKKSWDDSFEKNEEKLEKIVDSIEKVKLTCNGETIKALSFDCSSGVTQNSETVFGTEFPYLKSVQSSGDKLSPNYSDSKIISEDEFKTKFKDIKFDKNPNNWVNNVEKNNSGYVKSITVMNKKISGKEFAKTLGLKSAVFYISYEDNKFKIITYGNGHQVGMSRAGAEYMAKQGADYKEILEHYYPGVQISD
ncbi:MAG: SpoIID/LytB domain-containing protein [Ruminococcus sp.]|nr:SpoIID/LytB domain-containing protein [Candidatus Copronaster equi]